MTDNAPPTVPGNASRERIQKGAAFLSLVGGALLVGGLATTAIVANLAFRSPEILTREQAGLLNAKIFDAFLYVEAVAIALVAFGNVLLGASGVRGVGRRVLWLVLACGVFGHLFLGQRMRALRIEAGGSIERISTEDPRRLEFRRLHGIYMGVSLALLLGGTAVLASNAGTPGAGRRAGAAA